MRDQVWMKLVGCLYCRHREQAHSYSLIGCIPMNQVGQSAVIASKLCSYRRSKTIHHPAPSPFTTQGRALARLQAFDLDPAFDLPAPSGGRVKVFIWGSGAKRRAAKPHTSRGGRREADRRRCPQMDTGAREHRALARCRTLGRAFLVPFEAFVKRDSL